MAATNMFELPNAKRIKRSEMRGSGTDDTSSETEDTKAGSDYDDYDYDYDFIDKTQPSSLNPTNHNLHELEDEETYAFNLFAPKSNSKPLDTTTTTTPTPTIPTLITLHSPPPPSTTPQPRPQSYYLTSSLPLPRQSTLNSQYLASAISGSTILALATTTTHPWPGTHLPWRVIHIPSHKVTFVGDASTPTSTLTGVQNSLGPTNSRRPKPSKKRRIKIRERRKAREAARVAGREAEEAEREKRTRRNREKKVKKKLREKAKKKNGIGGGCESEGEGQADTGGGDGSEDDEISKGG